MPGFFGSHLGVIDLWLTRGSGRWQIARADTALRPISIRERDGTVRSRVLADPAIVALTAPAHHATLAWARRRIGHTSRGLQSFFALIHPCETVRLVARAQAAHVRQALSGTGFATLPILSAAAPFRAGGRGGPENYSVIPAGEVAMRHLADLYVHPNALTAITLTGAELADWLERSAGLFFPIVPGLADQLLIDPSYPSFNFDCIDGVTYTIDLHVPASPGRPRPAMARRIVDLRFQGRPVDAQERFVLATNSYRTGGSGGFAGARPNRVILADAPPSRDVLLAHITEAGLGSAAGPANWRFAPMPGTSVLFDSAPEAARHLDSVPDLRIEPLALTPEGFRRFRLHL